MSVHPHPTEILFLEDDDILRIKFSDDEEFDYDTVILRGYCPCAVCQGHGSRPHKWNPPQYKKQIVVDDIGQVGGYAMCIAWADGHNTGVYSWQYLREIVERPEEIFEEWPVEFEKGW